MFVFLLVVFINILIHALSCFFYLLRALPFCFLCVLFLLPLACSRDREERETRRAEIPEEQDERASKQDLRLFLCLKKTLSFLPFCALLFFSSTFVDYRVIFRQASVKTPAILNRERKRDNQVLFRASVLSSYREAPSSRNEKQNKKNSTPSNQIKMTTTITAVLRRLSVYLFAIIAMACVMIEATPSSCTDQNQINTGGCTPLGADSFPAIDHCYAFPFETDDSTYLIGDTTFMWSDRMFFCFI